MFTDKDRLSERSKEESVNEIEWQHAAANDIVACLTYLIVFLRSWLLENSI
ncbi:hypothetical protein HO614_09650 [Streptococcus suis]|nr:hypothetical protein [Streptococcus suis]